MNRGHISRRVPQTQQVSAKKVRHLGAWVALPPACPLRDDQNSATFQDIVRASGAFSVGCQDHLRSMPPADAAAWLSRVVDRARPMMRPWVMELIFLIGSNGSARFSDLERGLGISSKVLAARLRDLVDAGQVVRTVEATTPVRVAYSLTKPGRATAALATPLFTHLQMV